MKRILATIICLITGSCAVYGQVKPAVTANRAKAEQEVIKLENDWNEAMVKHDLAFFDHIIAEDWTLVGDDGSLTTKPRYLADYKSGATVVESVVTNELKVRVYGDAAVVVGRITVKGQSQGKDIIGVRRFTETWVKKDGRWICVATAVSKVATP